MVDKERQIGWVALCRESCCWDSAVVRSDESDGAWAWPARHEALAPTGPLIRHPPSSPQDGCLLGQSPEAQPELLLHDNECVIAPRLSVWGVGAHGTVPEPLTTSRGTPFAQSAANCGNHARLGVVFTLPLKPLMLNRAVQQGNVPRLSNARAEDLLFKGRDL